MNPDLFTTPEGIAEIRRSQEARFESDMLIDYILELQKLWKSSNHALEQSVARVNQLKKVSGQREPFFGTQESVFFVSRLFLSSLSHRISFSLVLAGDWTAHEGQDCGSQGWQGV